MRFYRTRGRLLRHWSCPSPLEWRKPQFPSLLWSTHTRRGVTESPFPRCQIWAYTNPPNPSLVLGPPLERNKLFGVPTLACAPIPPSLLPSSHLRSDREKHCMYLLGPASSIRWIPWRYKTKGMKRFNTSILRLTLHPPTDLHLCLDDGKICLVPTWACAYPPLFAPARTDGKIF
jgi:hypothetical protein